MTTSSSRSPRSASHPSLAARPSSPPPCNSDRQPPLRLSPSSPANQPSPSLAAVRLAVGPTSLSFPSVFQPSDDPHPASSSLFPLPPRTPSPPWSSPPLAAPDPSSSPPPLSTPTSPRHHLVTPPPAAVSSPCPLELASLPWPATPSPRRAHRRTITSFVRRRLQPLSSQNRVPLFCDPRSSRATSHPDIRPVHRLMLAADPDRRSLFRGHCRAEAPFPR